MHAQLVFNTWESKQLIAKTIVQTELVQLALEEGTIAVGRGMTNALILRELLNVTGNSHFKVDIDNYVAGAMNGRLCLSAPETRSPEIVFEKGVPSEKPAGTAILEMGPKDIMIKGANVLGSDYVPGVLCAQPEGGTIGSTYSTAIVRGIPILVPVTLDKSIPFDVVDVISLIGGKGNVDYARGLSVGLFPIVGANVFTEIEAIESFAEVDVIPIAAGGVHQGAGSIALEIIGEKEEVEKVIALYKEVRDTPALKTTFMNCDECSAKDCDRITYDW